MKLLLFASMYALAAPAPLFHDSHLHLTNYIQEGIGFDELLAVAGAKAGRIAVFGIPLQQQWSHRVSGNNAPTYYLDTDAPLYYYSFTDARVAMAYKALPKETQARLDPMITGFNPTDMYAADHIRRVLKTFPGVFSGIGEFTIHKEFVSSKVAGDAASLTDPAVDRILDLAGEVGLVALIHNDMDTPFERRSELPGGKKASKPAYLEQMTALLKRHPETKIIWAHIGLGRIIKPVEHYADHIEAILKDPKLRHVHFDLSWDETAKYLSATPGTAKRVADLINRFSSRFLFGTDEVAPKTETQYLKVYEMYAPLWTLLTPETRERVLKKNYETLFDEARRKVRAWERR